MSWLVRKVSHKTDPSRGSSFSKLVSAMSSLLALALIITLSIHISYTSNSDTHFIFVDDQHGNDEFHCIEDGNTDRPCRTLQYIAAHTVNNSRPVRIVFLSSRFKFVVYKRVLFTDVHCITIQGNNTLLSCHKQFSSGLVLKMASDVTIQDLSVVGCGVEGSDGVKAAILVEECANVSMENVSISKSKGVGLRILDTHGKVQITNCSITGKEGTSKNDYSTGLYIQFSYCPRDTLHPTNYKINGCRFAKNAGYMSKSNSKTEEQFRMLQMGGAIGMQFLNSSCFNNVSIINSHFVANRARWGGAIYIRFMEIPYGNNVLVSGTHFTNNKAEWGGGGTSVGYYSNYNDTLKKNRVVFNHVTFYRNHARYGGATIVHAKHSTIAAEPGGTVTFRNCTWLENIAYFSPAVDVSPYDFDVLGTGYLPIPVFIDCYFRSNMVRQYWMMHGTRNAAGAFLVTKFIIQFEGKLSFLDHSYTPLLVVSGSISFRSGSNILFQNNKGTRGGAIAMYGLSSLHVNENSTFSFLNNAASDVGGAIFYQSLDQHDFISARTCFIQYSGTKDRASRNITMRFVGNNASRTGKSIFAASLYPCFHQYFTDVREHNIAEVFQQIGCFFFDNGNNNKTIATEGNRFQYHHGSTGLQVIPGKRFTLPVGIRDELNQSISTMYRLDTPNISHVDIDQEYTANGNVTLFGYPCHNGSIILTSTSFREIAIPLKVTFLHCPPGYFYYGEGHDGCECAAYYEEHAYPGIVHCNSSLFRAYIEQDTWAGYPNTEHATPDELYTAACPFGFCALRSAGPLYLLPNESSYKVLDDYMCGHNRTGILCGTCDEDYSAYYHSRRYTCGTNQNCRFGFLFYILSELLPLTALFTTVIVFDIQFTSGTLNGFVFFSQVLDTLYIDARGTINFPPGVDELSKVYIIIYGLFNFEFFSIESLSFCLWEKASVLDVIAFKYITVAFALILVVALVTIMRWCNCQSLCRLKRRLSTKYSVIHGLSAFLVMCYAQCTQISFQILTSVTLTGKGGRSGLQVSTYGGIPYLGKTHRQYALPALLCAVTIVALPPILLLVFPLYNHVLAWCGLGETQRISRFLGIDRLKPILDSFQGCFKDRLRFFAGLYFAYRIAIQAAYSFSQMMLQYYFIVQVFLTTMLGLHATAQPYISRTHNAVDSLMFVTLALINALTQYNLSHRFGTRDSKMVAVFWFQLVLIYLPLVLLVIFIAVKLGRRFPKVHTFFASPRNTSTTYLSLDSPDGCPGNDPIPYQEFGLSLQTRDTSPPATRPDFGFDSL